MAIDNQTALALGCILNRDYEGAWKILEEEGHVEHQEPQEAPKPKPKAKPRAAQKAKPRRVKGKGKGKGKS